MKKILLAIVSLILAVGCTDKDTMPAVLGLDPDALTLPAKAGESKQVQILTNAETWSAAFAEAVDWCEFVANDNILTVTTLTENVALDSRAAVIVITADGKTMELSVEQAAATEYFTLDPAPKDDLVFLAQTGEGEAVFSVLTNLGEWTATLAEGGDVWCALTVTETGFTLAPKAPNFTTEKNETTLTIALKDADEDADNDIVLTVKQWGTPDFSAGGAITLLEDCLVNAPISVTGELSLNLNGFTLTSATNVCNAAEEKYALIQVDGGVLEIEGGTVMAKEDDGYALALTNMGVAYIYGGQFIGNDTALYVDLGMGKVMGGDYMAHGFDLGSSSPNLLDCNDTYYPYGYADIMVVEGMFYGFNPDADPEGEGTSYLCPDLTDLYGSQAAGYVMVSYEVEAGTNVWAATMYNPAA